MLIFILAKIISNYRANFIKIVFSLKCLFFRVFEGTARQPVSFCCSDATKSSPNLQQMQKCNLKCLLQDGKDVFPGNALSRIEIQDRLLQYVIRDHAKIIPADAVVRETADPKVFCHLLKRL